MRQTSSLSALLVEGWPAVYMPSDNACLGHGRVSFEGLRKFPGPKGFQDAFWPWPALRWLSHVPPAREPACFWPTRAAFSRTSKTHLDNFRGWKAAQTLPQATPGRIATCKRASYSDPAKCRVRLTSRLQALFRSLAWGRQLANFLWQQYSSHLHHPAFLQNTA